MFNLTFRLSELRCKLRDFQLRTPFVALVCYFCFAALLLFALHALESAAGMDKRTHIDSQTYVDRAPKECAKVVNESLLYLPSRAFYCVVDQFGETGTILINAALVAFTSALMVHAAIGSAVPIWGVVGILGIIFAPYRLHLGIHILKDSFIQLFIYFSIFWRGGVLWLFPMMLFRPAAAIYFLSFFRVRYIVLVTICVLSSLFLFAPKLFDLALRIIINGNHLDFVFQEYDKVPTFQGNGLMGDLIRALVWPFFLITGSFILLSPALLYYPIALTGVFTLVALYAARSTCSWERILLIYLGCGAIAYIAPGFTGYTRYAYPLVTVALVAALVGIHPNGFKESFGKKLA